MNSPRLTDLSDLGTSVSAHSGFPNAATDDTINHLSLDRLLVPAPNSTYFFRIQGSSWANQGVRDGDIVIVDRSAKASGQRLVAFWHDGAIRLSRPMPRTEPWGVITTIIRTL